MWNNSDDEDDELFLLAKGVKQTAQKMKFSIKGFFSKCDHLVTFTEEIFNGKLHFFCSGHASNRNLTWADEPRLYLMKLESSDNCYTKTPQMKQFLMQFCNEL